MSKTAVQQDTATLILAGHDVTMRRQTSKKGNAYFGVLAKKASGERYFSQYGVPVAPLADDLPDVAVIEGVIIPLVPGVTGSGNPKTSGSAKVTIDGVELNATVIVSDPGKGTWNLIAKAIPAGGGGGSRGPVDLADL